MRCLALLVVAALCFQVVVSSSASPSVTPSVTPSPDSLSVTPSVTPSPDSLSSTPSVTPSPDSLSSSPTTSVSSTVTPTPSVTSSVTPSPMSQSITPTITPTPNSVSPSAVAGSTSASAVVVTSPSPSACPPMIALRFSAIAPGTTVNAYAVKNWGASSAALSGYSVYHSAEAGWRWLNCTVDNVPVTSVGAGLTAWCNVTTALNPTAGAIALAYGAVLHDFVQWGAGSFLGSVNASMIWTAGDYISGTGPFWSTGDRCTTGVNFWRANTFSLATAVTTSCAIKQSFNQQGAEALNCILTMTGGLFTLSPLAVLTVNNNAGLIAKNLVISATSQLILSAGHKGVVAEFATISGLIDVAQQPAGNTAYITVHGACNLVGSPTITLTVGSAQTFAVGTRIVFLTAQIISGAFNSTCIIRQNKRSANHAVRAVTATSATVVCTTTQCYVEGQGATPSPSSSGLTDTQKLIIGLCVGLGVPFLCCIICCTYCCCVVRKRKKAMEAEWKRMNDELTRDLERRQAAQNQTSTFTSGNTGVPENTFVPRPTWGTALRQNPATFSAALPTAVSGGGAAGLASGSGSGSRVASGSGSGGGSASGSASGSGSGARSGSGYGSAALSGSGSAAPSGSGSAAASGSAVASGSAAPSGSGSAAGSASGSG